MPTAIFRTDASPTLGAGHVARCMTLAHALTTLGWECRFACGEDTPRVVPALAAAGFGLTLLPAGALADPKAVTAMVPAGVDLAVVDHYGLDATYERPLRHWAGTLLVLDDLADRPHVSDILLDQTAGRAAGDYARWVPADGTVLAGAHHALLRPDYAALRPASLARRRSRPPMRRLLVTMGGTDPGNATGLVLAAIALSPFRGAVDVVMGRAAPHLDSVRRQAASRVPPARVLVDVAGMASLMAAADLAIGAAGTTSWERCCLGLPSLMVITADNQRLVAANLAAAGAAQLVGEMPDVTATDLAGALTSLLTDKDRRLAMTEQAQSLCDGSGAPELAARLDSCRLVLRPAEAQDGADLLAWRNDPLMRVNALTPGAVRPEEHAAWLTRVLADPDRILLVGEAAGKKLGMVRFDRRGDGTFEISFTVAAAARGRGQGSRLLAAGIAHLQRQAGPVPLLAVVKSTNTASRRSFEKCGFALAGEVDGLCEYQRS